MEEDKNYQEAYEELKGIIADLENSKTGIDELEEKVIRATHLLEICRTKLLGTEQRVMDSLKSIRPPQQDNQEL